MSTISGKRLRIRRGDGTRTLANGELEFDYVNSKLRVGDGSSVGGIGLAGQSGFNLTRASAGYVFPSESPAPHPLQGTTSGYIAGGQLPAPAGSGNSMIQKFSFTSDGNAVDVADLTQARGRLSGTSSPEYGYAVGGNFSGGEKDTIDRFPFASEGNATDVGELLYTVESTASHTDGTDAYISGGDGAPLGVYIGLVQRFPFSSSITASDVGDFASVHIQRHAGVSSTTHGYTMGGKPSASYGDQIHKFTFSSSISASDIGNLTQRRQELCGQTSKTHGYSTGGYHVDPTSPSDQVNNIWNTIDKIAFANDGNATDVGDLPDDGGNYRVRTSAANESTTNGYASGGQPNVIEEMYKFPFASDTNATDIGDLVNPTNAYGGAGNMNGR